MNTAGMDDTETRHRRLRLRELVDACFAGSQKALIRRIEERTGEKQNQGEISGLVKLDNPSRSFGDKKARTLTERIGLDRRWFDLPLGTDLDPAAWGMNRANSQNEYDKGDKSHASELKASDVLLSSNGETPAIAAYCAAADKAAWPFAPVDPLRFYALSEKAQGWALGQFQNAITEAERLFAAERDENAA